MTYFIEIVCLNEHQDVIKRFEHKEGFNILKGIFLRDMIIPEKAVTIFCINQVCNVDTYIIDFYNKDKEFLADLMKESKDPKLKFAVKVPHNACYFTYCVNFGNSRNFYNVRFPT
jgi:hypothetical protein